MVPGPVLQPQPGRRSAVRDSAGRRGRRPHVRPAELEEFVRRCTTTVALQDGTRARLRPIVPDDKARLVGAFERLSPESRYRRFMAPIAELSDEQLAQLTELDYRDHFARVAL